MSKPLPFKIVGDKAICNCGKILPLDTPADFTTLEKHLQSQEHIGKVQIQELIHMGQDYEERAAKAKVKTLSQIMEAVDIIQEVYVPELDAKILYKKLNTDDMLALPLEKNLFKYNSNMLFAMLKKADPTLDREEFEKRIPFDLRETILHWITQNTPFLHLKFLSPAELRRLAEQSISQSAMVGTPSKNSEESPGTE